MLNQLAPIRMFLAVVEFGSVHEAARRLNLSQPAVTRQIKALEDLLGIELFYRSAAGMDLSKLGRDFAARCRRVEQTWRYANAELSGISPGPETSLRIGAGPIWSFSILPEVIVQLHKNYPGLSVEVLTHIKDHEQFLASGKIDLFIEDNFTAPTRVAGLTFEPLVEREYKVFAHPQHTLTKCEKVHPEALLDYPWIMLSDAVCLQARAMDYFADIGLPAPQVAVTTPSLQTGLTLIGQNDYLMMLPDLFRDRDRGASICAVPIKTSIGTYKAALAYRSNLLGVRAYGEFRRLLIECCNQLGL